MKKIPKIIHYCWFGGKEKPKAVRKMIESWKKKCPDYKIIEWNESNSDLSCCNYIQEAYQEKKYAFVADYVRMKVLYEHGGIYLDTDVELIKELDEFLENEMTIGFQDETYINTGLIISKPRNKVIEEMLEYYHNHNFIVKGQMDLTTNVVIITNILLEHGLIQNNNCQNLNGINVFSNEYFAPLDFKTRELSKTEKTYAIHWFDSSWMTNGKKIRMKINRIIRKILGEKTHSKLMKYLKKIRNNYVDVEF